MQSFQQGTMPRRAYPQDIIGYQTMSLATRLFDASSGGGGEGAVASPAHQVGGGARLW